MRTAPPQNGVPHSAQGNGSDDAGVPAATATRSVVAPSTVGQNTSGERVPARLRRYGVTDREYRSFKEQEEREEAMCDGCGIHPKDGLYSYTHCEHCMNRVTEKKMKQAKKKREKKEMAVWTDEQWDAWAATQVPDIAVWSEEEYEDYLKNKK